MATQLRSISAYQPTITETIDGLASVRSGLAAALPEADSIDLSFGEDYRLMATIKIRKREDRDLILFRLRSQALPSYEFVDIIERVETGARRRLVITAEVR